MIFQLCYASTSTSEKSYLPLDLREVLNEAHHFNYVNNIHGVLYFADGYFFQCLEGEQAVILELLDKIRQDPRHHQIYIFNPQRISQGHFNDWSMKFVRKNSQVSEFFQQHLQQAEFNPYLLNEGLIAALIPLLADIQMDEVA
ncbi:BLUF domain-containing protein [Acinetobacter parvus]|uniref:BLUF domain-containing protein n=1 Tax=Acinetobacter parvus DSM 16617 = CIP 108168 TaxID=981333 RepID=N8QCF2_9GAMM|nr:BLUF domain-containing protein [Acinetobacter parvus]ENU36240.1 hypothetical protein F988_01741 [Acinetobacter parvus DSM 16617 = CIP 108168]MCU4395280.1 BLUF domain-containing protein [Acinetobacter parvus]